MLEVPGVALSGIAGSSQGAKFIKPDPSILGEILKQEGAGGQTHRF